MGNITINKLLNWTESAGQNIQQLGPVLAYCKNCTCT